MAKTKSQQKDVFLGVWRITSMSAWEDGYLDAEVEAHITFDERGGGWCRKVVVLAQIMWHSRPRL